MGKEVVTGRPFLYAECVEKLTVGSDSFSREGQFGKMCLDLHYYLVEEITV